jgi:hypothetical protein
VTRTTRIALVRDDDVAHERFDALRDAMTSLAWGTWGA